MLHHLKILLIVVAAMVGFAAPAYAQDLTSPWEGRHFLLAFPDTTTNLRDPINLPPRLDTIALVMYSPKGTHVAITGPGGYQRSVTLPAGEPTEVYLDDKENPATRIINDISGVVTRDVFSVEADDPITLYCWMMTPFGGEAWTPLPVEKWGKEYQVISALPHVVYDAIPAGPPESPWRRLTRKPHSAPVYMAIIAAHDGTDITVTSPNRPPGGSKVTEIHLNAGECYQLQWSDTGAQKTLISAGTRYLLEEPSGTMIRANKPIAVVGGASRARELYNPLPGWDNYRTNSAIEWLLPISVCDTVAVLIAPQRYYFNLGERLKYPGEPYMIAFFTNPNESDVRVSIDAVSGIDTIFTIRGGEVVKWRFSQFATVTSDKPIQIMTLLAEQLQVKSGDYTYLSWGSSSVTMLPRLLWYNEAIVHVPDYYDSSYHFITVVADTNATVQMSKQNQDTVGLSWNTIVGSAWKSANLQIEAGATYFMKSDIKSRFMVYNYGTKQGFSIQSISFTQDTCYGPHYDELSLSYAFPFPGYIRTKPVSVGHEANSDARVAWADDCLYPNPARDAVRFSLPSSLSSSAVIEITDCLGRSVVQKRIDKGAQGEIALDIKRLDIGTYIVRVVTATGTYSTKLVKY